jgi:hypothetical protein
VIRRILKSRKFRVAAAMLVAVAFLGWRYQSQLIGVSAQWYLQRVADEEEKGGDLTRRRQTISRIHRQLLIAPPPDALVPELYDLVTLLSTRVATGEINLNWSAYVYTTHLRDTILERPDGTPRRRTPELNKYVEKQVEFFYLRKNPNVDGFRLDDFVGDGSGESFTVEEIEKAHREGRELSAQ